MEELPSEKMQLGSVKISMTMALPEDRAEASRSSWSRGGSLKFFISWEQKESAD
jgi:hypothetical protein